jgi:uroporphyrinogen-III synthase
MPDRDVLDRQVDLSHPVWLVVRPQDRWADTLIAFEGVPFAPLLADVFSYIEELFEVDDYHIPQQVDGCLLTSARAVNFLCHYKERLNLDNRTPLYVVGERTANALIENGFNRPVMVAPDVCTLYRQIKESTDIQGQSWLYVRGDVVSNDLAVALKDFYIHVSEIYAYKSFQQERLSDNVLKMLDQGAVKGVLFFSSASATHFMTLMTRYGYGHTISQINALCISKGVLDCLHSYSWKRTDIARTPDVQGMVQALRDHLSS